MRSEQCLADESLGAGVGSASVRVYHGLMPVIIEQTPNPNALKFTVGQDVGGPTTVVAGQESEDATAQALVDLPGVTSVFMTADFVTLTRSPDGDWAVIADAAKQILEERFG